MTTCVCFFVCLDTPTGNITIIATLIIIIIFCVYRYTLYILIFFLSIVSLSPISHGVIFFKMKLIKYIKREGKQWAVDEIEYSDDYSKTIMKTAVLKINRTD